MEELAAQRWPSENVKDFFADIEAAATAAAEKVAEAGKGMSDFQGAVEDTAAADKLLANQERRAEAAKHQQQEGRVEGVQDELVGVVETRIQTDDSVLEPERRKHHRVAFVRPLRKRIFPDGTQTAFAGHQLVVIQVDSVVPGDELVLQCAPVDTEGGGHDDDDAAPPPPSVRVYIPGR